MHFAVLGNPGSWYVDDIRRAAEARGIAITRLDFPRLAAHVSSASERIQSDGRDVNAFDAVIVRTMPPGSLEQVVYRMDVLGRLAASGVTVINSPKSIECAVDKYLTTARLHSAGLPVPETVVCEDFETAMEAFARLGGDVVVKPVFGAEGRGIIRVSDADLAHRAFRTLERLDSVLYIQRFVDHPGHDLRILVLGGRVLGAMRRRSPHDFRTNVARKAVAEPWTPSDEEAAWALRAADAVAADFAGIDLLEDRESRRYVLEVNAVPGWRAFAKTTGHDVAASLLEEVRRRVEIARRL